MPGSIQSRRPREPDILCELEGEGPVAFELVDLVDQDIAHVTAEAIKDPDNARGTPFDDPTLDRVRDKLGRTYVTQHPIELLAHGDDLLLWREAWRERFEQPLREIFDATPSPFRRLWVVNLGRLAADDPLWLVHPGLEPR